MAELRCAGEAQAERQQQQAARQAQVEAALEAHGAAVGELRAGLEGPGPCPVDQKSTCL